MIHPHVVANPSSNIFLRIRHRRWDDIS